MAWWNATGGRFDAIAARRAQSVALAEVIQANTEGIKQNTARLRVLDARIKYQTEHNRAPTHLRLGPEPFELLLRDVDANGLVNMDTHDVMFYGMRVELALADGDVVECYEAQPQEQPALVGVRPLRGVKL